ncbi:MAG: hypothetical protein AB7F89_03215 [Pirellulaceae bacterium]
MSRAILLLIGLILVAPCAGRGAERLHVRRAAIDDAFQRELESLAARCDQLGLASSARTTRDWYIPRHPGRQYLFTLPGDDDTAAALPPESIEGKWQARFRSARKAQAAKLFELAREELDAGDATSAYQLLHEVLHEDPQHAAARRILALDEPSATRPRSRAARIAHPQFGWPAGRWWQIESRHFQVSTNLNAAAGLELARRLEEFRSIWAQVFYLYWNTPTALQNRMAGEAAWPASLRRHQVVLFRNRQDYLTQLAPAEPQIEVTLGYYHKAKQTAFFYGGDPTLAPVQHHEAAHQLFQETGEPTQEVGEKWNFWAVEGVAVYFESLADRGPYYTLGGFDADRLQFLRSRVLGGEPQLPLPELTRLGREALQHHPDIRRLYPQSAGLAHFLCDYGHGQYRRTFVEFLAKLYSGADEPDSLPSRLDPEFDAQFRDFLTVTRHDLEVLRPPYNLRHLSLVRADIDDASLALLEQEQQLEWLDLSFTLVSAQGLDHLAALPQLKRLTLVGVPVGDEAAGRLAALRGLEELDLSGTRVGDEGLRQLTTLSRLKLLRLAHTAVTDTGIGQLQQLKRLEEIDVESTAVTPAALESLRRQLPRLQP